MPKNPTTGVDKIYSSTGQQLVGPTGALPLVYGTAWFVSPTGNNALDGLSTDTPFLNWQTACDAASPGDTIYGAPGVYDETVTIRVGKKLTLIGLGGRGSVRISPTDAAAVGLTVNSDDVTLMNITVDGDDTAAYACRVYGDRFRAYSCKFMGTTTSGYTFGMGPQTVANIALFGMGSGADGLLVDCQFTDSYDGVMVIASDAGAATKWRLEKCSWRNVSNICLGKDDVAEQGGGKNVEVVDCNFGNMEDGTQPADYIDMDASGYTGYVTGCSFALPTNAAADLKIAATVMWMANATEAGWSTARPA